MPTPRSRPDLIAASGPPGRLPTLNGNCPPITSASAGAAPLYGTCTMSMCVIDLSNSIERCGDAPTPDEPKLSLPGFALALAITSPTFLNGCAGLARKTFGVAPTIDRKEKSLM